MPRLYEGDEAIIPWVLLRLLFLSHGRPLLVGIVYEVRVVDAPRSSRPTSFKGALVDIWGADHELAV